jgi:hypothetical protein
MLLEASTNVGGADREFAFESELGKDYCLEVFDEYKRHGGKYKLTTH